MQKGDKIFEFAEKWKDVLDAVIAQNPLPGDQPHTGDVSTAVAMIRVVEKVRSGEKTVGPEDDYKGVPADFDFAAFFEDANQLF